MAVQVPLAGSKAPTRHEECRHQPPATSTWPLGSNVAVWTTPSGGETGGGRPDPARRIVELRARETLVLLLTSCDKHLAA